MYLWPNKKNIQILLYKISQISTDKQAGWKSLIDLPIIPDVRAKMMTIKAILKTTVMSFMANIILWNFEFLKTKHYQLIQSRKSMLNI